MVVFFKKGNAMPLIIFIGLVFLLVLILSFAIGHKVLTDVNDMVQDDDDFTSESKEVMQDVTNKNATVLDNVFVFLYGGLLIGAFLSGFTVGRSPVFLLMTIILIFAVGFVGAKISNFYEDFDGDSTDLAMSTNFPKANFIMSHLPLFIIGIVMMFGIAVIVRQQTGFL